MHSRRMALGLMGAAGLAARARAATAPALAVLDYEARLRRQLADPPPVVWPELAATLDVGVEALRGVVLEVAPASGSPR
jgi:hypothetical protein